MARIKAEVGDAETSSHKHVKSEYVKEVCVKKEDNDDEEIVFLGTKAVQTESAWRRNDKKRVRDGDNNDEDEKYVKKEDSGDRDANTAAPKADTSNRVASCYEESAPPAKRAKVSNASLPVEVDEGVEKYVGPNCGVYTSQYGTVFDATLHTKNEFYRIQLLNIGNGRYRTWTRWGQKGQSGHYALWGNGIIGFAFKNFHSKFKQKTGLSWAMREETPKNGMFAYVKRN